MSLTSVWLAVAFMTIAQQGLSDSAKVAVVNIPTVSERYARTADLEAQFEQRRVKFNEQRNAFRERIDRTGRSLQEEFKPGTNEFEQRRKQLVMLQAELQWFVETESEKIEADLARSLRSIYDDILAAVREVAGERGIDVVLGSDRFPEDVPQSSTQVRQQIVLQKVLYWNPRIDLTDEVVARVNAMYKARGLHSPSGASRPPLSGEGLLPIDPPTGPASPGVP